MEEYEARYVARTGTSKELFARARALLPGGVTGNNKFLIPHPIFVDRAAGCRFWDVDGNEYIDLLVGGGPQLLGHSPRVVVDAVKEQVERGTLYCMLPTSREFELAERINRHMPHLEEMRFANSGSEATIAAVRIARAFTGRQGVAKFDGHFHGHANDSLAANSVVTSPEGTLEPAPDWAGISRRALDDLLVLPYNDVDAAVAQLRAHGDRLAAVIVEPVPVTSYGGMTPDEGFLEALREVTEERGILLIFDEIITAFRLGMGGARAYFGVTPDLTTFGKIIGGGLPIGAFGGRRDILEAVVTPTKEASDEERKVFHSGTFTGNPLSLAAGIAAMDEIERRDIHADLARLGERMREGLRAAARRAGIGVQVMGVESMFCVQFSEHPIRTRADVLRVDPARHRRFCFEVVARGVFWPPFGGGFLCAAHTTADVDHVVGVVEEVLVEMAADDRTMEPSVGG